MPDPTEFGPDRLRVVLDHGEVVELDGGTLVLNGEESASVVLRLALWRARLVAWVLEEWSYVPRIFTAQRIESATWPYRRSPFALS
jgi:hypothetical protein